MNYLFILEFSINTEIQDLIYELSEKYWNFKGYYKIESKGKNKV